MELCRCSMCTAINASSCAAHCYPYAGRLIRPGSHNQLHAYPHSLSWSLMPSNPPGACSPAAQGRGPLRSPRTVSSGLHEVGAGRRNLNYCNEQGLDSLQIAVLSSLEPSMAGAPLKQSVAGQQPAQHPGSQMGRACRLQMVQTGSETEAKH